jgi:hypothetical protein
MPEAYHPVIRQIADDTPPWQGGESVDLQYHIFLLLSKEEYSRHRREVGGLQRRDAQFGRLYCFIIHYP